MTMPILLRLKMVLVALLLSGLTPVAFAESEGDYRLGVGDVISISVHDEPDLSLDYEIPKNGKITYPFLGALQGAGKSVTELKNEIIQGLLGDYLVKPQVSVQVTKFRPVFVTGQVVRAGGFPYVLGLTVEKAVTLAGGFTDRASKSKIYRIPENGTQSQRQTVTLDTAISPGDTLIIEESIF